MRINILSTAVAYSLFFQPVLSTPASNKCDANNCLRAVLASSQKPGPASASADCASFFLRTVTPATITSTDTVTVSVSATASITTTTTLQTTTSTTTTLSTTVSETDTVTQTATTTVSVPFIFQDQNGILGRQVTAVPSLVPAYASACSGVAKYSSACSCIGAISSTTTVSAPTTRVTVTVSQTNTATQTLAATATSISTEVIIATNTATIDISETLTVTTTTSTILEAAATPDASCNNGGLEFAFYTLSASNRNNDQTYSTYDPTYIKTLAPEAQGLSKRIGGFEGTSEGAATIYNTPTSHLGFLTINHRGYFYAPQTGIYTISLNQADDIACLWTGQGALQGWTRNNALTVISYYSPGPAMKKVTLTKGQYLPIRIVYANAQGGSYLRLTITGPDSTTLVSQTADSQYLVSKSCDGTAAPGFVAPFGNEV